MAYPRFRQTLRQKRFWYRLPRKKVSFSYGNLRLFQISNFKNRSFLSGQEAVQFKPNLIWSIPGVGRLWDKKNFWYGLPRKKVSFSYVNFRLIRIINFK